MIIPGAGLAELVPDEVFEAACSTLRQVAPELAGFSAASLAISAQGEAFVPVDGNMRALMNAPISIDARGAAVAESFARQFGATSIAAIAGHRLTSQATLAKLLWLKGNAPETLVQTRKLLCFGEYIVARLGVVPCVDRSMAARTVAYDIQAHDWSDEILEAAQIERSLLPPIVPSGTRLGLVPADIAADLGFRIPISVFAGGHDQACAALGAGITESGKCLYSIGTTEAWLP